MTKLHSGFLAAVGLAMAMGAAHTGAQGGTPYKLGMFDQNGRQFVGLVLNDAQIVDLSRAVPGEASAPHIIAINSGGSLKQLIGRWDAKIAGAMAALAANRRQNHPGRSTESPAADTRSEGAAEHRGQLH